MHCESPCKHGGDTASKGCQRDLGLCLLGRYYSGRLKVPSRPKSGATLRLPSCLSIAAGVQSNEFIVMIRAFEGAQVDFLPLT